MSVGHAAQTAPSAETAGDPAAGGAAGPSGRPSNRRSARGSASSASMSSSATRTGQPVTDLTQADFEVLEDGQPQTIETFKLVEITGIPQPGDEPPREIRSRVRRRGRSLARRCPAVRHLLRRLPRAARDRHERPRAAARTSSTTRSGPLDLVGLMYPLTPVSAISFSRNRVGLWPGQSGTSRDAGTTTSPATSSRRSTRITRRRGRRADPQPGDDERAGGAGHPSRVAARGAQGRHPGQRRVLQPTSRPSCAIRSPPCPAWAIRTEATPWRARGSRRGTGTAARHRRAEQRTAGGLRRGQQEQHGHLRARSPRPGRVRVRHRPGRRAGDRSA